MRKNNEYMRIYVFRTESRYSIEKLQAAAPSLETVINDRKHTSRCVCSDVTMVIAVVRCCSHSAMSSTGSKTVVIMVARSVCKQ
jgi:hypothetical protein